MSNFWPSKLKRTKGLLFRYTSGAEAKLVQLELSNAQSFIWGHARILQCTLRNLSHLPISSFQIKTALQFYQNDENVELEKSDLADCDNFSFIICDSFNLFFMSSKRRQKGKYHLLFPFSTIQTSAYWRPYSASYSGPIIPIAFMLMLKRLTHTRYVNT